MSNVKLIELPLVVIFWSQEGCPHCETTRPRWEEIAQQWSSCIPSARLRVEEYEEAATTYHVRSLPTLMILRFGRASWRKLEGEATSEEIQRFYEAAAVGMDCAIGAN